MEIPGTINPQDVEDILPLTPMQESMLFQYLKEPDSKLYFEQNGYELTGTIRTDFIQEAWNAVANRNEVLRTVFRWMKLKKPVQVILKNPRVSVKSVDLSQLPHDAREKQLDTIKEHDLAGKIDLRVEPLRVTLCKMSENRYEMIVTNHHILFDGWSNVILLKEFLEAYHCLGGSAAPDKPVKTGYREYIKGLQKQDKGKQENYWRHLLEGASGKKSSLPHQNTGKGGSREKYCQYPLDNDLTGRIRDFSQRKGITPAVLYYSAWAILIYKYTQVEDVLFGITVSGRKSLGKGIQNMVGLFINTLPLRINLRPREHAGDLLARVNALLLEMEEFESTPLLDILSYCQKDPKEALFDSVVVIQNYPVDKLLYQRNHLLSIGLTTRFYLTGLGITLGIRTFDGIILEFAYNTALYRERTIKNLSKQVSSILGQLVGQTGTAAAGKKGLKIKDIDVLDQTEKEKTVLNFQENRKRLEEIDGVDFDELL
jgi:hypothetical protein